MQELDRGRLAEWLAPRLGDAEPVAILEVETPSGGGASADTLMIEAEVDRAGTRLVEQLVLRRDGSDFPLFLEGDLERQAAIMAAMRASGEILVPEVIGFEPSDEILGRPFLVMRRKPGRIVPQKPPYNAVGWIADLEPAKRLVVWQNAIEAMAAIHATPLNSDFAFLSKDSADHGLTAYLERMTRWYEWAAAGREQPVADAMLHHLLKTAPSTEATGIVWGDAQPANILFTDDLAVSAILDWEMAGLGPGEIDLGWWLLFDRFYSSGVGIPRLPGLPDRDKTIAIYERAAGRLVTNPAYFELLAMLRLAIVAVRQCDRQISLGRIPATSRAHLDNPITAMMAAELGLPVPEVGADFHALHEASTSHQ